MEYESTHCTVLHTFIKLSPSLCTTCAICGVHTTGHHYACMIGWYLPFPAQFEFPNFIQAFSSSAGGSRVVTCVCKRNTSSRWCVSSHGLHTDRCGGYALTAPVCTTVPQHQILTNQQGLLCREAWWHLLSQRRASLPVC